MTVNDWSLLFGAMMAIGAVLAAIVLGTIRGAQWCLDRVREIVVEATYEIGQRVDGVKEEVGTMRGEVGVVHSRIDQVEGRVEVLEQYEVVEAPSPAKKTPKKAAKRPARSRKARA